MQKNVFLFILFVYSISFFTSCKDDDNNYEEPKDWAAEVAGTYKGDLAITMDGADLGTSTQFVSISHENMNVTKLELKNFAITIVGTPVKVGDIIIPNVPVSSVNSTVSLQETSTVINHPALGQLNVKTSGVINNNKADLHITVFAVTLGQNIDVTFSGVKTEETPDYTDYAAELAAWYKRESLTITGDTVDSKYPNDGLSLIYQDVNTIAIESFFVSFQPNVPGVSNTRSVPQIDSIVLKKGSNGMIIDTVRTIIPPRKNSKEDTAYMVLSGNFQGKTLTLNMQVTTKDKKADYVFVGSKKLTGANINKMTINSDVVAVQPEIEQNDELTKHIMIYVKPNTTEAQLNLVPNFEISEGAVISFGGEPYVAGTPIDFSKECKFHVKSQSGKTNCTYVVNTSELNINFNFSSDFEVWETKNMTTDTTNMYQMFDEPANGWATSNEGVKYIKLFETLYNKNSPYAVEQTTDKKSGAKAAKLTTIFTTGQAGFPPYLPTVPKITTGTVFTGTFIVGMSNTLKSTKFGYPCFKKPTNFSGSYKFTPGTNYYYCANPVKADEAVLDNTKTDAPAINAVLYEVGSYTFDFLDGTNLLTSDKIVAKASVQNPSTTSSYVDFNINFDWGTKTFDPAKKYKLAIVCSSSKDGDKFSGAPGSVLYVDDLKVNF